MIVHPLATSARFHGSMERDLKQPNPMMFRSALNRIEAHSETTAMIATA